MKAELVLLTCAAVLSACVPVETSGSPDPIGDELLSFTTALGVPGCVEGHLYRSRELVQFQCFASDGSFSWENRGTLSAQGRADLETALTSADLTNTTPSDAQSCGGPESGSATMTLWVDSRSVSYRPGCPIQGIQQLDEIASMLLGDIGDCIDLDLLDSVEPGCRAY